jgi:hypothetical protein
VGRGQLPGAPWQVDRISDATIKYRLQISQEGRGNLHFKDDNVGREASQSAVEAGFERPSDRPSPTICDNLGKIVKKGRRTAAIFPNNRHLDPRCATIASPRLVSERHASNLPTDVTFAPSKRTAIYKDKRSAETTEVITRHGDIVRSDARRGRRQNHRSRIVRGAQAIPKNVFLENFFKKYFSFFAPRFDPNFVVVNARASDGFFRSTNLHLRPIAS